MFLTTYLLDPVTYSSNKESTPYSSISSQGGWLSQMSQQSLSGSQMPGLFSSLEDFTDRLLALWRKCQQGGEMAKSALGLAVRVLLPREPVACEHENHTGVDKPVCIVATAYCKTLTTSSHRIATARNNTVLIGMLGQPEFMS